MNTKELILLVALLAMVGTMIGVAVAVKSERCDGCGDEENKNYGNPKTDAERARTHFRINEEDWYMLDDYERDKYIDMLPKRGIRLL